MMLSQDWIIQHFGFFKVFTLRFYFLSSLYCSEDAQNFLYAALAGLLYALRGLSYAAQWVHAVLFEC